MTLPDDRVLELLQRDFVVGWKSIETEEFCGVSKGYSRRQTAVGTTNGAGGRNVQLLVLSPDLVVMHALPGFWHPEDLVGELHFAKSVHRLWQDQTRSRAAKNEMFFKLHELALRKPSDATTARSEWQGFDRRAEMSRASSRRRATEDQGIDVPERDTMMQVCKDHYEIKPLNVLVHERMAQRPFVPLAEFDMEAFVDYGRAYYDNNSGRDKGRTFGKLKTLMAKRAQEKAREARKERAERKRMVARSRRRR